MTSNWIISEPELIQWSGIPSNNTLSSMWPGLEIPKGTYPLTKYAHWYYLQITLTRNEAYSSWLALIFWTPTLVVPAAVIIWAVQETMRPRSRQRRTNTLSAATGPIALLAYTFVISQAFPQKGITLVQYFLVADFILLILAPSIVALRHHQTTGADQSRPLPSGVYG